MPLTVLYFAGLRDLVPVDREQIEVKPGARVSDALVRLKALHSALQFEGVRCAVNEEFVQLDQPLQAGDILALIPPVSGG